ncbi:MAG: hypothetical protein GOV00_03110 [Candidatus Altiarchaeota archaeon]|nr:hypothetical protein [Candidatus Altiarchaeota archaeon]
MFLLSLDGPDFSGKTTLATAIVMRLREMGKSVERTEVPSGMITGIFTDLLRNSRDKVDARVFALTYAADHLHHYFNFIENQKTDFVLIERSLLSTFFYQGTVGNLDMNWVKEINKFTKTRPDLTVIVKTPLEELLKRKGIRIGMKDQLEKTEVLKKSVDFFYNVPKELADEFNVKYVDYAPINDIVDSILALAKERTNF